MAKAKFFNLNGKAYDDNGIAHVVTVVGKLEEETKRVKIKQWVPVEYKKNHFVDGTIEFPIKRLHRTLTIGYAICNPDDDYDEEKGIKIATERINKGNAIGKLETNNAIMLTKDSVTLELLGRLMHINENLDKYINKNKKAIKTNKPLFDPDIDSIG